MSFSLPRSKFNTCRPSEIASSRHKRQSAAPSQFTLCQHTVVAHGEAIINTVVFTTLFVRIKLD